MAWFYLLGGLLASLISLIRIWSPGLQARRRGYRVFSVDELSTDDRSPLARIDEARRVQLPDGLRIV